MKKSYIAMSAFVAVILVGCITLQPIGAMRSLENALANKDEAKLKELVDFATLKQNVKYQLHGEVGAASTNERATGEYEGLIGAFGDALLDQAVTPKELIGFAAQQSIGKHTDPSYRYLSLSKFATTFQTAKGEPIIFILEREGASWRLTDIKGFLDNYVPFPVSNASPSTTEDEATDGDLQVAPGTDEGDISSEQTLEVTASVELEQVTAQVLSVLGGSHFCVDQYAFKPTCVQTSSNNAPSAGNKFLDVAALVKNVGSEVATVEYGSLTAKYQGRDLRYEPIGSEGAGAPEVQALGTTTVHTYYEVPIEVLNNASFYLTYSNGEEISFDFETPAYREVQDEKEIKQANAKEQLKKEAEQASQARYDKCWALNDGGTPLVSREDYDWYIESCSNMYRVDEYEAYLKNYRGRK